MYILYIISLIRDLEAERTYASTAQAQQEYNPTCVYAIGIAVYIYGDMIYHV